MKVRQAGPISKKNRFFHLLDHLPYSHCCFAVQSEGFQGVWQFADAAKSIMMKQEKVVFSQIGACGRLKSSTIPPIFCSNFVLVLHLAEVFLSNHCPSLIF
jgi:hypothetical protein